MEPVRNDTTADRRTAVELAKRLLVDSIWRTAKIEVDGVTFPDTQEIFDGRAPEGMSVDDIVTVNNIKRAWGFLLDNIDYPVDWQYIREYNRIIGEGLVRDAGRLREYGVRIGGTGWVPEIPTVESSQERVRGILEESEGEDTAMLLFGAVTRGQWFFGRQQAHRADGCQPPAHTRRHRRLLDPSRRQGTVRLYAPALLRDGRLLPALRLALTERRRPCARRADFGPIVWGRGKDE